MFYSHAMLKIHVPSGTNPENWCVQKDVSKIGIATLSPAIKSV